MIRLIIEWLKHKITGWRDLGEVLINGLIVVVILGFVSSLLYGFGEAFDVNLFIVLLGVAVFTFLCFILGLIWIVVEDRWF